jgi:hypothetical protein
MFFALIYLIVFLGITIFKFKLRRMQRRAEEHAGEGRTQYADGQIIYSKNDNGRKHFRQTDGEYVDFEEIK